MTRLDIEARKVRDTLERAAAANDPALALEAARDFAKARMTVTVAAPDFSSAPSISAYAPTPSRPFFAKFAGRCAVCDVAIAVGAPIVLRSTDRAVLHPHCGATP